MRFKSKVRKPIAELLERRTLLSATAAPDAYTVVAGQTFVVSTPRNELHTDYDNGHPGSPSTWTDADGDFTAVNLRTGVIQVMSRNGESNAFRELTS